MEFGCQLPLLIWMSTKMLTRAGSFQDWNIAPTIHSKCHTAVTKSPEWMRLKLERLIASLPGLINLVSELKLILRFLRFLGGCPEAGLEGVGGFHLRYHPNSYFFMTFSFFCLRILMPGVYCDLRVIAPFSMENLPLPQTLFCFTLKHFSSRLNRFWHGVFISTFKRSCV